MKRLYVKIEIQDLIDNKIKILADQELVNLAEKHGINVKLDDDLGKLLAFRDIAGYRYLFFILLDSKDGYKRSYRKVSEEEIEDTIKYLTSKGFELVERIPFELSKAL